MSNKVSHGYDIWYVRAPVLGRRTVSWIDVVNYLHVSTQLRHLPQDSHENKTQGVRPGIFNFQFRTLSTAPVLCNPCRACTPASVPTQPQPVAPLAPRACDFLALARSMQGATTGPGKSDLDLTLDRTMLHGSMVRFLQALPHLGITAVNLLDIMKCVLGLNGAWFFWGMSDASKRRCQRATHDSCKDLTQFSVFVACLLLRNPWDWLLAFNP